MVVARICQKCVKTCKDGDGLCAPPGFEEIEGARDDGMDLASAIRDHRRGAHVMRIQGARWRCDGGHSVEAEGYEHMAAAGYRPWW